MAFQGTADPAARSAWGTGPNGTLRLPPAKVWAGCLPSHPFHRWPRHGEARLGWAILATSEAAVRGPVGPARALSESELAEDCLDHDVDVRTVCLLTRAEDIITQFSIYIFFLFILFNFARPHYLLEGNFSPCPLSEIVCQTTV